MRRLITVVMIAALGLSGCATGGSPRIAQPASAPGITASERDRMSDYASRLPVGSRVKVHLADGRTVRGTLMGADANAVIVSPATRIPEPPVSLPESSVRAIEIDRSANWGKVIAVGAAAGAAATLGIIWIFWAIAGD